MTGRERILLIGFMLVLPAIVPAQLLRSSSQTGAGTGRNFTLYGDLKIFESDGAVPANTFFDLILYTRGYEAFARQRAGKGGRYSFKNIPEGNYYIAVELDNVEIARVEILISQKKDGPIRQDLELDWNAVLKNNRGVVSALDSYSRTNQNRERYDRAMKEINKNELSKATATLRSLVEADPKDFRAWHELGMVYFVQKNFAAAENSFAKAVEVKPDYVTALVSLGRVRLAQKNNEGAIEVFESALKADPESAVANYFLGEAYLNLRKGSMAVTYMNEALKLDPIGMANAHLRLATLYNLAGYKERAAIEYNEFLKKKPDYPESQRLRDYIIANGPRANKKPRPSPTPSPTPSPSP
jgi:Tfp pilus assembly protein PilF